MAEGKKSFVLYADLLLKVEHLTNEEMGILFRHMLEYVNDLNPNLQDRLVMTAWKPIEVSLKEDLKKWESIREKRSEAGAKGGRPPKAKKANAFDEKQTEAKKAVTVTVTDTVTVEEDKSSSQGGAPNFEEWQEYFEAEGKDPKHDNCRASWLYYHERGWKDRDGNQVKNWKLKVRNTNWWKDCPKAQVDIYSEHCKANPPSDWLDDMAKYKWPKKEAAEAWRNDLFRRKEYFYPNTTPII